MKLTKEAAPPPLYPLSQERKEKKKGPLPLLVSNNTWVFHTKGKGSHRKRSGVAHSALKWNFSRQGGDSNLRTQHTWIVNLWLGHLLRRQKNPFLERMDYWYKLEQDPTREADRVPCSHWSPLAAWQTGALETRVWSHRGEKRILTGTSTSCVSILVPATRTHFWGTDSSYLYLIFRCSHTVCFCLFFFQSGMKHTVWITTQWWCVHFYFHFSKKNERICILKWSANICPGFFSSTVKLKKKKKLVGGVIPNTTVTQCFVSICKYLSLLLLWLKIMVKSILEKEASVYIKGQLLLLKIKIIWPKSHRSVCLMLDIFLLLSL